MPVSYTPTFHDRQSIKVIGPLTTTSSTFVTIPGATVTTKDLGSTGNYVVVATINVEHSNNNATIDIRALIDGVPTTTQTIAFGPNSSGDPKTEPFVGDAQAIEAGAVVTIEWSTPSGTATLNSLSMIIDGIPASRVI